MILAQITEFSRLAQEKPAESITLGGAIFLAGSLYGKYLIARITEAKKQKSDISRDDIKAIVVEAIAPLATAITESTKAQQNSARAVELVVKCLEQLSKSRQADHDLLIELNVKSEPRSG